MRVTFNEIKSMLWEVAATPSTRSRLAPNANAANANAGSLPAAPAPLAALPQPPQTTPPGTQPHTPVAAASGGATPLAQQRRFLPPALGRTSLPAMRGHSRQPSSSSGRAAPPAGGGGTPSPRVGGAGGAGASSMPRSASTQLLPVHAAAAEGGADGAAVAVPQLKKRSSRGLDSRSIGAWFDGLVGGGRRSGATSEGEVGSDGGGLAGAGGKEAKGGAPPSHARTSNTSLALEAVPGAVEVVRGSLAAAGGREDVEAGGQRPSGRRPRRLSLLALVGLGDGASGASGAGEGGEAAPSGFRQMLARKSGGSGRLGGGGAGGGGPGAAGASGAAGGKQQMQQQQAAPSGIDFHTFVCFAAFCFLDTLQKGESCARTSSPRLSGSGDSSPPS